MAKDPYRYFRIEAHELLEALSRGLLALDKERSTEQVRQLLRQAHTFKGAARVVKLTDLAELAHRIEDLLSPHRAEAGGLEAGAVDQMLRMVDTIRASLARLGEETGTTPEQAPAESVPTEGGITTLRIGVSDLDGILEGVAETISAFKLLERGRPLLAEAIALARSLASNGSARDGSRSARDEATLARLVELLEGVHRAVTEHGERALGELEELRSAASELRLLGADVLLAELERAARDAARVLDRKIEFLQGGAEIRIDAYVLSRLRGALRHVVRNAVAHGIEPEAERIALGKPPAGLVRVTIERRGHRIAVTCRDDGRGLQSDDVRRIARQRGLLADDSAAELDPGRLARILLGGGVSTARSLTEVAGRGVGLDVVRATVEELGGEVGIETDAGAGTRVEIVVPFSLSSMPALRVQADGRTSFIALDSVQKTRRLRAGDIVRSEGRQRLVDDDVVTPFLPLARALGGSSSDEPRALQTAVVVEAGGRRAAVGVDRVFGVQHVVVRSVPDHVRAHPIVAGAALDPDGVVELVVAPAALVQMAEQDRPSSEAVVRPARPPLLVIDDSLTTRMLEQSILESAGYRVDLAVSGEEGLKKAKQRRYGLFIVDVEMPGMSGFEFIERTRGDAELRQVPALLVTSRASQDDKRRGKEAGARGYIVKSEFDQGQFLDAIQRLVG